MRKTLLLLCALGMPNLVVGGEPFRRVLLSAGESIRAAEQVVRPFDAGLDANPAWSVEWKRLHGGKQEGVDLLLLNNGKLKLIVVPTRGMSILSVDCGDIHLGWKSPVQEVVHPQFIDLASRGGLGWLEGFNEWMVRCGLEYAGHPGKDVFVNNVGDKAEMDLTLHGRIGNIPASTVEVLVEREAPYRIHLKGRVVERCFYGPKLEIETEIVTEPGASHFAIRARVSNRGAHEQEMELIYHANFGAGLLEQGAQFRAAVQRVTPFNAHAAKDLATFATYAGPTPGYIEQVYCIQPLADGEGFGRTMLRNAKGDRGVALGFRKKELPYLTLWKNTAATEEGYVTGIEPGTSFPRNRRLERLAGRVPKLKPGESRDFLVEIRFLAAEAEVRSEEARIDKLQKQESPVLDPQPEKNRVKWGCS